MLVQFGGLCVPFAVAAFLLGLVAWFGWLVLWYLDLRVELMWIAGLMSLGVIAGFDWSFGGVRGCLLLVVLVASGWWFEADLFPSCGGLWFVCFDAVLGLLFTCSD